MLSVESLRKSFKGKTVLDGIDLRVRRGDRVGLAGPNGSGKTTFLRCVAGTVTPDAGIIMVAEHRGGTVEARALIGGAMAHEKAFYQRLSGLQNLAFYASLRWTSERKARADVASVVEELGISHFVKDRVNIYSSGMCQQLGVARALIGNPAILILDEPTRSLDDEAAARLWAAVNRRPEASLLIASHRASDLERCGSRLDFA